MEALDSSVLVLHCRGHCNIVTLLAVGDECSSSYSLLAVNCTPLHCSALHCTSVCRDESSVNQSKVCPIKLTYEFLKCLDQQKTFQTLSLVNVGYNCLMMLLELAKVPLGSCNSPPATELWPGRWHDGDVWQEKHIVCSPTYCQYYLRNKWYSRWLSRGESSVKKLKFSCFYS